MLEASELVGALAEFDEVCEACRGRVVIITPSGDGDLRPQRFHESRGDTLAPCEIARARGDDVRDSAHVDELLGVDRVEGPEHD